MVTSLVRSILVTFLVGTGLVLAQERLDLTTSTTLVVSNYSIDILHFEPRAGRIYVRLVSNVPSEPPIEKTYDSTTTPTGTSLMHLVNTSDNTTVSLEKKVLQRVAQDVPGLSGTVSGTPR